MELKRHVHLAKHQVIRFEEQTFVNAQQAAPRDEIVHIVTSKETSRFHLQRVIIIFYSNFLQYLFKYANEVSHWMFTGSCLASGIFALREKRQHFGDLNNVKVNLTNNEKKSERYCLNQREYSWQNISSSRTHSLHIFACITALISMCGTKVKFPVRQLLDTFRRSVASSQSKKTPKFRQINLS